MRYEGRHAYFKQIATRSNNFKNLAKTLAIRNQLKQCLSVSTSRLLDNEDHACGVKKSKAFHFDNRAKTLLIAHFGTIDLAEHLYECDGLWYDHIEYRQSCVYVVGFENIEERPLFVQIIRIIRSHSKWWLFVDRLITKCYSDALCSWEIESAENFSLVDPHDLKYYHKGLDVYEINNSSFVSLTTRLTNWE
jgi:hypothetical protein